MSPLQIREQRVRRAISKEKRVALLAWLTAPDLHFGWLDQLTTATYGVPIAAVAQKWCVAETTAQKHLGIMVAAGLLTYCGTGKSRHYRRNDAFIRNEIGKFGIHYIH